MQTIQYQINTLMTTNGQSPFVTIFMFLDKDDEYIEENALIIEEILKKCNLRERIILKRNKELMLNVYNNGITFGFNNK